MCYSLFAALFSKIVLSHPPFKYPRSAPVYVPSFRRNTCINITGLISTFLFMSYFVGKIYSDPPYVYDLVLV